MERPADKKCPFCNETIKFEAIKCRFCGEILKPEISANSSPGNNTIKVILIVVVLILIIFGIIIVFSYNLLGSILNKQNEISPVVTINVVPTLSYAECFQQCNLSYPDMIEHTPHTFKDQPITKKTYDNLQKVLALMDVTNDPQAQQDLLRQITNILLTDDYSKQKAEYDTCKATCSK